MHGVYNGFPPNMVGMSPFFQKITLRKLSSMHMVYPLLLDHLYQEFIIPRRRREYRTVKMTLESNVTFLLNFDTLT